MTIKYSIITPVYNREDCIMRCLESVTRATALYPHVEQIVVDDGSRDNTAELVAQYATAHSHVRLIRFPYNRGTNAARNAAISAARGEWCTFLDSDDYWEDTALQTIDAAQQAHPEVRHLMLGMDDCQLYYDSHPLLSGRTETALTFEDFLMERVSGDFQHVMRTDILRRHPFPEQLRIYEGLTFLSLYKDAESILFVNHVVSHRERSREDSVSREFIRTNDSVLRRQVDALEQRINTFRKDYLTINGGGKKLHALQLSLIDNLLLLGRYCEAKAVINEVRGIRRRTVPRRYDIICHLHLGRIYFFCLRSYLYLKYNVLHTRLGK